MHNNPQCLECRHEYETLCLCPNNVDNFKKPIAEILTDDCKYVHYMIDEKNMTNETEDGLYD